MCLASITSAGWKTTQLTTNSDGDWGPQINNNGHAVWRGQGGDLGWDYEIFYYDGSTVTALTSNNRNELEPQIS